MELPKGVRDNLFFLLAETQSQIGSLDALFHSASAAECWPTLSCHSDW